MDGQSLGIPVGPDTSLVISEIIGTAMDLMLGERLQGTNGFRHIDDYYLYFGSHADAHRALDTVHGITQEFELELNPQKTRITELPEPIEAPWVSELRLYSFRSHSQAQRTDLISYFSKAFGFAKQFPDDSVLKYALARIRGLKFKKENWPLYESLILRSIMAEPNVLPIATGVLLAYSSAGYELNKTKIAETVAEVARYSSTRRHVNEVAWALWLDRFLGIRVAEPAAREVSEVEDSVVALAALDLRETSLVEGDFDLSKWEAVATGHELYGEHWLLAYEGNARGWLPPSDGNDYVGEDDFFGLLREKDVLFFQPASEGIFVDLVSVVEAYEVSGSGEEGGLAY